MKPLCSAHRTNGDPCGNYPVPGARVCRYHGGKASQVRAAAAVRLAEVDLEKDRRRVQYQHDQLISQEVARQKALQPWEDELGPRFVWSWHSPAILRRIASEMRATAAELTKLASSSPAGPDQWKDTPCTDC